MNEQRLAETIISRMENAKNNNSKTAHILLSTLKENYNKELLDMKQFMELIGLDYKQSTIPGAAMISLEVSIDELDVLKGETF